MSHYNGNIEHQIEVFRSPENYGEIYGGRPDIHIAKTPASITCHEVVEEGQLQPLTVDYLILRQHRCSIHITQELLNQYYPNFNFRGYNLRENNQEDINIYRVWIVAVMKKTAEAAYQKLKEETWDNEHNVLIDSVKIIWQYEFDRILIDIKIYACRQQEAELAQHRFQQTLMQLLQNSVTFDGHIDNVRISDRQMQQMGNSDRQMQQMRYIDWLGTSFTGPIGKKYDDKAEKQALKLLKSMLSKNEFKIYQKDGYVIIEGTKNRMYKIKKNSMIEVSEKRKNNLYEAYRICIEPKHHGTICPTDEVVAKIKLIQSDEDKLHSIGQKFKDNSYNGYRQGNWEIAR